VTLGHDGRMTVRGGDLAESYWRDVVRPLVHAHLGDVPHAAGQLGAGSEVLGLDDDMSRDHDWGPRLTLLVPEEKIAPVHEALGGLGATFRGLPTRYATTGDPRVVHRIEVADPEHFARRRLGIHPAGPWEPLDWLSLTGQSVLELRAGRLFVDTDGRITRLRDMLAWYPDDLWRHVVACDWHRLGQELPFIGRTAERGDEVGSRVVTARLVRTAMHLGFMLERRWPPYPKWFGTMFARLPSAGRIVTALDDALAADTWTAREAALCAALDQLLPLQGTVGLPAPDAATGPFFDRPYRGVSPHVVRLLLHGITDRAVRVLPLGVGAIEQWVDDVDVLTDVERRRAATHGANAC
jgi:Domain of unknown function (DUF4037)